MAFGGFGSTGFGNSQPGPFGGGAFGQQQSQPTPSPSPFGQPQQPSAFGQQNQPGATPFGGGQPSGFGAPAAGGAFGSGAQTGGFGQPSTSTPFGGGTSAFGAKPPTASFGGFGASAPATTSSFGSTPAAGGFGAPASTGFGQQPQTSTPFGGASTGAFGSTTSTTPFGGGSSGFGGGASAFGQPQTQSAFGSTPASSAFGGGASGGAFGQPAGVGGMQGGRGTGGTAWRKTQEIDQSSTGTRTTVYFNSITCMPEYVTKSVEELRWEDYEAGNKGGQQAGGGGIGGQTGGMFGSQPASSTPFGGTQSPSTGAFGAPAPTTSAFGAPSTSTFGGGSAFGASSTPAFGTSSAPAFGAAPAAAPAFGGGSAFGATSAPAFGAPSSAPAFGASSAPAFGAPSSAPAFGAPASSAPAPAFGGGSAFGAPSSTPAFGAASSTPAFGAASSTPAFGSSTPAFGAASSTPAFGSSTPAFGAGGSAFGASSTPAFGASSTPAFGATGAAAPTSTPAFSFGGAATTPKPASFQFNSPAPATTAFGATPGLGGLSTPAFGAASSTPAFGGGSLFGSTPGPSATQPAAPGFGAGGLGTSSLLGSTQPGAAIAQPAGAGLGASSPYGNMPAAPKVTPLPEYKVGLTQRILAPPSAGPPKPIALITPRSLTPHGGGKIRPRVSASATRMSKSPADFFASSTLHGTPGSKATSGGDAGLFVPREDPRRLLIRDELPLPSSAKKSTSLSGRTPNAAAAPGAQFGRGIGNGTPGSAGANGGLYADGVGLHSNGLASLPSPLTLKSLSPQNTPKDNIAVLPILTREGYSLEPSMKQLAAMAMDDPQSLKQVANFTVRKQGVGSVTWLETVDVRNLDLDAIVALAQGSIDVYPDETTKPPVGNGLNRPAVITMLNIFKLDKATGLPTKDPELVEKYSKKLKAVCASQSARFISYDGEKGVWKFETEHFSRYGLVGTSDDEDDGDGDGAPGKAAAGAAVAATDTFTAINDHDSANSDFSDLSDDSDGFQLGIKRRYERQATGVAEATVTVDDEISAQRPPVDVLGSLRAGISTGTGLAHAHAHTPTGFAGFRSPGLSPIGLHRQLDTDMAPTDDGLGDLDDAFVPISSWKPVDGIPRGLHAPGTLLTNDRAMNDTRDSPMGLAHRLAVDSRNLADYGALMHDAFAPGWYRGCLVVPSTAPVGSVTVQAASSAAGSSDSERQLLLDQLMIHKDNSFPVDGTPAERAPRMQLKCGRSPELLRKLTMEYIDSLDSYIERQGDEESDEAKLSQAEIWELVNVLFSLVPAEEDPIADDASDASDDGNLMSLAGMQRRAKFSSWLKSGARDGVRRQLDAIRGLPGKDNEEVLMRLSGYDLAGAVKAAASAGNVRLSTLLATAGSSADAVQSIVDQLSVWKEEGYTDHIDGQLMQVYEVLAGNVDPAMYVVAEDWKRSLGMHVWYAKRKTSPISESVESYLAAVQTGNAPYPGPWHPVKATDDARRPTDTAFELIRMFCFSEEWESEAEKAAASLEALPDLLCPLGTTPDVHRADFYWHLLCVLEAISVVPDVGFCDSNILGCKQDVSDAVSRVVTSFIAQLESVGGMFQWAIYVALHIGDDDYRDIVVNDLLSRYVEEWHADAGLVDFLVQELGVPVAMLEAAKATWADHVNDDEMLLDALIESGDWNKAHDVLRHRIAPTWFLAQSPAGNQGAMHGSLLGALEEFESRADMIDAGSWRIGGELYLSYFRIREKHDHVELDDQDRLSIDELAHALDDAVRACVDRRGEGDDRVGLEKAAYAYLARELARMGGTSEQLSNGTLALRSAATANKVSAIASVLLAERAAVEEGRADS